MNGLLGKIFLPMIVSFVIRQINKFGAETDWVLVRNDCAERVAKLIPGDMFDGLGVMLSNMGISIIEEFIKGDKDEQVINLIAEQKYSEAFNLVYDFLQAKIF